jgi:small-conductance mechanosensitive channel
MSFFNELFARLSVLATHGPFAGPIWAAVIFLCLYVLRTPLLKLIFHLAKVDDEDLRTKVKRKVDVPLQLLLVTLAVLPFTFLLIQPIRAVIVLIMHVSALFLLFYIAIQTVDLALFSWYLVRRQTAVSGVVRVFVLFVLYGVAALLTLDWGFGVSILPLLATSTVVSAVIGLALQDTLKNAFAGLNMSIEKSFVEGDWVLFRLDAAEQWFGQIVEIGWRTTKIRTLNNNYAVVPNSNFTNRELINFSKPQLMHARTIDFPVSFAADGAAVKKALIASALSVDGVLSDPAPQAQPLEMKADHVLYQLRFWMNELELRDVLTGRVMERSWKELQEQGALPQKR